MEDNSSKVRGVVQGEKKKRQTKKNIYLYNLCRVFNLAEPTYDFITDSYQTSKPYVLSVASQQRIIPKQAKKSSDADMMDLISYLGGEGKSAKKVGRIGLSSSLNKLDFTKQDVFKVQVKLDGGVPGKILQDAKANAFLSRMEHYISHPNELVI